MTEVIQKEAVADKVAQPAHIVDKPSTPVATVKPATPVAPVTPVVPKPPDRIPNLDKRLQAMYRKVCKAYRYEELKRCCEMEEKDFVEFGTKFGKDPDEWFIWKDNDGPVLAVAHLDVVADGRWCETLNTPAGDLVFSPGLDDRLGAYIILYLLPRLGIKCDILLTTGEEKGKSTAGLFNIPDKQYNWMLQYDRGHMDAVFYGYGGDGWSKTLELYDYKTARGANSDIGYLEHLGCKGVNVGINYQNYHSVRAYVYMEDALWNVAKSCLMYEDLKNKHMPHKPTPSPSKGPGWAKGGKTGSNSSAPNKDYLIGLSPAGLREIKDLLKSGGVPWDIPAEFDLNFDKDQPHVSQRIIDWVNVGLKPTKQVLKPEWCQMVRDIVGRNLVNVQKKAEDNSSGNEEELPDSNASASNGKKSSHKIVEPFCAPQPVVDDVHVAHHSKGVVLDTGHRNGTEDWNWWGDDIDTKRKEAAELVKLWNPIWDTCPPAVDGPDYRNYLECVFFMNDNGYTDMKDVPVSNKQLALPVDPDAEDIYRQD